MNDKALLIIGCGGHSKVVTDIANLNGFDRINYLCEKENISNFLNKKVYRKIDENFSGFYFVAIGDNFLREKIYKQFKISHPAAKLTNLIHPKSSLSENISLGKGIAIMTNSAINPECEIGDGVIINTGSSVDHECKLDAFSSIAPGVTVGGKVQIGLRSSIGIGSVIKHGVIVGKDTVLGASSLLLKNLGDNLVAYGSPAKMIKTRREFDNYL